MADLKAQERGYKSQAEEAAIKMALNAELKRRSGN
jgi:hypothetical protein